MWTLTTERFEATAVDLRAQKRAASPSGAAASVAQIQDQMYPSGASPARRPDTLRPHQKADGSRLGVGAGAGS